MRIISVIVCIFLTSCTGYGTTKDSGGSQNREILSGDWGWDNEQCQNNPMSISFGEDGKTMFHDSPKGMHLGDPKKAYKRSVYVIHSQSPGVLSTIIEKEDRKDANGNLVSWDLIIQSEVAFCWHRSDWKAGSCTKSMTKCQ